VIWPRNAVGSQNRDCAGSLCTCQVVRKKEQPQVPRALITGITGQDGLYLAEFLAAKGYEVFGMVRGQSNPKIPIVEELIPSIQLLEGDLRDLSSLIGVLEVAQPDEVYNLGAISFVGLSFKQPELTGDITGMGCCPDSA